MLARAVAHIILSSTGRLDIRATCKEQPTKREAEDVRVSPTSCPRGNEAVFLVVDVTFPPIFSCLEEGVSVRSAFTCRPG